MDDCTCNASSTEHVDHSPTCSKGKCDCEENNNGTDIRTSDNFGDTATDSNVLHPAPSGDVITLTEEAKALVDADLGASKPIPEPKPTRKQIGEWRNANFTVRHSTVNACGHKLDLRQFPSNANCWDCWEAFFSVSPEGVASVHQLLLNGGTQAVVAMHGKKFTKMFGKFLQKKLLKEYASPAVQAASGIEGSIMNVKEEIGDLPNLQATQE